MNLWKNIRLGMMHMATAATLVPITGVLNRVMIHEFGMLASLVAALIVLPNVLSPLQVWVGQFSDRNPLFGYRRSPYIALGAFFCVGGAILTPHAALLMAQDFWPGLLLAIAAFGSWGIGFNIAVVSYLSLASDLTSEKERSRTIAIMWFMMISSVIATAIISGQALDPYSDAQLVRVFNVAGLVAFGLIMGGLIGLEPRYSAGAIEPRHGQQSAVRLVIGNPQARRFFVYLTLLLAAILGQDVLLEPYGAQVFGMSVRETTQLTAVWGGMTLASLLLYGMLLSRWMSRKTGAVLGSVLAASGLLLIATSGWLHQEALFVPGVALLGFGTGIATTTNLALMLDMTTPEQAGVFIGAWGVADALARGTGNLMSGVVRDLITYGTGSLNGGYVSVFLIQVAMLGVALLLLRRIDVVAFRVNQQQQSLTQIVALAGDAT